MNSRSNKFDNKTKYATVLNNAPVATITPDVVLSRQPISSIMQMINEATTDSDLGSMFMRLYYILLTLGQKDSALEMQSKALNEKSLYRILNPDHPAVRLLAFMGPGDSADNAPLEYLIENSDIRLDLLYVSTEKDLPDSLPDHDIAIVALSESNKNLPLLTKLKEILASWPRPCLIFPNQILNCARHKASVILQNVEDLVVPQTKRLKRENIEESNFPVVIRPVDSHRGEGLEKLDDNRALIKYIQSLPDFEEFYISEFIDYRSADGFYRKYRIALIDRKPYICHLAISDNWIVHYASSGMESSAVKRNEEKNVMENFFNSFALRHHESLKAIADLLDLDFVVIDCSETKDGRLLFFEADTGGWIHATDNNELFSYKPAIMQKAFDAFRSMLIEKSFHFDQSSP